MSAVAPLASRPQLRIDYVDAAPDTLLAADDTLAVIGFGPAAPAHDDPRVLRVALQPDAPAPFERWRGQGPVMRGRDGGIAWAEDGALQFGSIHLQPGDDGDLAATAASAYARLRAFTHARGYPHLLRAWNYLDGITHGDGDGERYRVFCVGRARGLGELPPQALPAGTAIGYPLEGRADGGADGREPSRLLVYWLAARTPGTPLENPRQVSAWRYPRRYGPQPPSFVRAMLPASDAMPLLISGTAAVVGHESRHAGSITAQLEETVANLDSLVAAAHAQRPGLPPRMGAGTTLKAYVREREELATVRQWLLARLDPAVRFVVLHGAICRRELRVEIDGSHS